MEYNNLFKNDGLPNKISKETLSNMTDSEIEEMASVYSENNKGLKELLIYCAKNTIRTFASCGGHPDTPKSNDPYIGFIVDSTSIDFLYNVFTNLKNQNMRFLFHRNESSCFLSIFADKDNSEADFLKIKNQLQYPRKDYEMPDYNLFFKSTYLSSKIPGYSYLLINGMEYASKNDEPLFTLYSEGKEYFYPIYPTKKPYVVINRLLDNLTYRLTHQQDIQSYLKLYSIQESCKHIPHMGLNLLNTLKDNINSIINTKEIDGRETWTK